jgi:hypothetical protein
MNGLELPTDNLYKFMAIAGLATALSCTYFSVRLRQDVSRQWYRHLVAYQAIPSELELLKGDVASTTRTVSTLKERTDELGTRVDAAGPSTPIATLRALRAEGDRLKTETQEISRVIHELPRRNDELRAHLMRDELDHVWLKDLEARTSVYTLATNTMAVIGFLVAVAGFYLWYVRVQCYLDHSLREGATSRKART